ERRPATTTKPMTNHGTARLTSAIREGVGPVPAAVPSSLEVAARATYHVAASKTGRIARFRVSLTTVATSPAPGENAWPVATTCAVSFTARPAHVPKTGSDIWKSRPRTGSSSTPIKPKSVIVETAYAVSRCFAPTIGDNARIAELPQIAIPTVIRAESGGTRAGRRASHVPRTGAHL